MLFPCRIVLKLTLLLLLLQELLSQPQRSLWLLPSPTVATPATTAAKALQTFKF